MDLLYSPRAERDLEEIGDYIARDSPLHAIRFVERLRAKCQMITDFPAAAPLRNDLAPGIRATSVGQHVIFYRVLRSAVRIERVLHGARDIERLMVDPTKGPAT